MTTREARAGDTPEAPPAGGPSEALFSESETLAPLPLRVPPPDAPPDEPYISCVNPRLPARPRGDQQLIAELPDRDDVGQEDLGFDEDSRGSLGTTWQLMALGAQNYRLDLNPQMTFFRAVWKRHTEFALECFEDSFDLRLGGTTTIELPRRGDMLGDVVVQVTLPDLGIPGGRWADGIGYVLLTRVRFAIDELVVHDQERLWHDISDKLFMPHGRLGGIDAMIGRGRRLATDRAHTVLVPLKLACCKAHYSKQQLLPIAALATKSKITLELGAEGLAGCLVLPPGAAPPPGAPPRLAAKLLSQQVFLERDEQRAIMRRPRTLLIETVQDVDALAYQFDDNGTYDLRSSQLDLRELNLPVKLLAFVAYDENDATRGVYFKYLDCVAGAVLLINSGERFRPRAAEYFALVQTYQHCTRCTPDLVHAYSFALDAGERQPSGALNFATLDRPLLRIDLRGTEGRAVKLKCFASCYNWLTIASGSAAMRFA